jgi:hypothetical protein
MEGHGSLGKVTEPCGAWWRIKEACKRSYDMSGRKSWQKVRLWKAALWVLSEYPPSLFWCHMYHVLDNKMLWDWKKYRISIYGKLLD